MARETLNEKLDALTKSLEDGVHSILDELNPPKPEHESRSADLKSKLSIFGKSLAGVLRDAPTLIKENPREVIGTAIAVVLFTEVDGVEEALENQAEPNSVDLNTVRL